MKQKKLDLELPQHKPFIDSLFLQCYIFVNNRITHASLSDLSFDNQYLTSHTGHCIPMDLKFILDYMLADLDDYVKKLNLILTERHKKILVIGYRNRHGLFPNWIKTVAKHLEQLIKYKKLQLERDKAFDNLRNFYAGK